VLPESLTGPTAAGRTFPSVPAWVMVGDGDRETAGCTAPWPVDVIWRPELPPPEPEPALELSAGVVIAGVAVVVVGTGLVTTNAIRSTLSCPSGLITTRYHVPASAWVTGRLMERLVSDDAVSPVMDILPEPDRVRLTVVPPDIVLLNPVPVITTLTAPVLIPVRGLMEVMEGGWSMFGSVIRKGMDSTLSCMSGLTTIRYHIPASAWVTGRLTDMLVVEAGVIPLTDILAYPVRVRFTVVMPGMVVLNPVPAISVSAVLVLTPVAGMTEVTDGGEINTV